MKYTSILVGVALLATGCVAPVGANVAVPHDAASSCASQCSEIGLALDSVVIMANNVGCVCRSGKAVARDGASGSAGGMTAILLAQQQQQQSSSRPVR